MNIKDSPQIEGAPELMTVVVMDDNRFSVDPDELLALIRRLKRERMEVGGERGPSDNEGVEIPPPRPSDWQEAMLLLITAKHVLTSYRGGSLTADQIQKFMDRVAAAGRAGSLQ